MGADHAIRRWAERHGRGYVLAVTSRQRLGLRPVTSWIKGLPERDWRRLSAGDGAKGPRLYDWAYVPYSGAAAGLQSALLVRRFGATPTELAFYLTHAPEGTTVAELVRVAGTRWNIESLFEQGQAAEWTDGRSRARPIRGALVGGLAPARDPGDARPRLPRCRP